MITSSRHVPRFFDLHYPNSLSAPEFSVEPGHLVFVAKSELETFSYRHPGSIQIPLLPRTRTAIEALKAMVYEKAYAVGAPAYSFAAFQACDGVVYYYGDQVGVLVQVRPR